MNISASRLNSLFSFYCSFNNRQPFDDLDLRLSIRPFVPHSSPQLDQHNLASPSRMLSNLFWRELPWSTIKQELGEFHVVDTGCGSGSYGDYLDTCSNGNVTRYVGLDVSEHPSWGTSTSPNRAFHRFNGRSIAPHIPPQTNVFMSQSAIEHFPNDRRYFEDVQHFIQSPARPILQVHLFPSAACMRLYGRHGYRQYTPRTVSRITRMFPDAQCHLFGLGGPACNRVHDQYITQPLHKERLDYRRTKPEAYCDALTEAIKKDVSNPSAMNDPSFWALVVCSNWKQPFVI
ncbi:MAG: hypothetical protein NUV84_01225 [Candidatus Uhrbacteria bacterium]|nr:hypothetical protein [Candidatus Uhrbacteria bacterium]